jgi:VanZ family protein
MPLLAVALLVLYGSVYPFQFELPTHSTLHRLFDAPNLWTGGADALGNIALFMPWGIGGIFAWRVTRWRAVVMVAFGGLLLATTCQLMQLFVPVRDPNLSDVFWNMVGVGLGIGLALVLQRGRSASVGALGISLDALLLSGCLLVAWLPLVPTLDLGLLSDHLKALLSPTPVSLPNAGTMAALTLCSAHLAGRLGAGQRGSKGRALLAVVLVLSAIVSGQAVIPGARLDVPGLLGVVLGGVLWWAWQSSRRPDTAVLAALVVGLQTLSALAPFNFSPHGKAFGWLPFKAMLEGSMLANAQTLSTEAWLWGAALLLAQRAGARVGGLSIALALWVLALEALQCFLPSRTPDLTLALVILGLGWALNRHPFATTPPMRVELPVQVPAAQTEITSESWPQRRRAWPMLARALALTLGLTVGLHAMHDLPGLPYNVGELFRGGGHPAALAAFALALLWLGAGAAWAGDHLARLPSPGLWVGPVALAVALISLALLSLSVTSESLADIAGSMNLFWFVTERQIWGPGWPEVFAVVGSPVISALERGVRFSALYGPLPVVLGGAIAARSMLRQGGQVSLRLVGLAVGAMSALWLCKAIAFDWSSTDNLNELIARDGPWGWGGGGYLYALLALLCGHAWVLSQPVRWRHPIRWWPWLATPASVMLGWWLLNQGLESQVYKYELVYSGAQFLLGPDRQHLLTETQLLQRWAALQVATTMVLALGLWLYGWVSGAQVGRSPQTNTSTTTG